MVIDYRKVDVVDEIRKFTGGVGVDVAIEALGTQPTFEAALRKLQLPSNFSVDAVC